MEARRQAEAKSSWCKRISSSRKQITLRISHLRLVPHPQQPSQKRKNLKKKKSKSQFYLTTSKDLRTTTRRTNRRWLERTITTMELDNKINSIKKVAATSNNIHSIIKRQEKRRDNPLSTHTTRIISERQPRLTPEPLQGNLQPMSLILSNNNSNN